MRRTLCSLLLAAAVAALPATAMAAEPPPPPGVPSAVALSYDGQHLAFIVSTDHGPQLQISGASGQNAHAIALAGGCAVAAIRWAPDWNRLAALGNCTADSGRAATGAVWLIDASTRAAQRLATLPGNVRAVRWTANGNDIAFLYSPNGHGNAIGSVSIKGGAVHRVTPAGLDVREFSYPLDWNMLVFTAMQGADTVPALFVQNPANAKTAAKVFDPNTAAGDLHDLYITQPRVSRRPGQLLVFLGKRSRAATQGNLYLVPGLKPGATPINLDPKFTLAWYTFERADPATGDGSLATRFANGKTDVVKFVIRGTHARRTALLFSVPGTVTDATGGHARGALSTTLRVLGNTRPARVAFLQEAAPGTPIALRSGRTTTQPPPVVAIEAQPR